MRDIPQSMQDAAAAGVTTFCQCWKITRNDGVTLGFTNLDRDVVVEGVRCVAATGLTASEVESGTGFAVLGSEVQGAFTGERVTERDVMAGLYDDANVVHYVVNWKKPEDFVVLATANIGEIKRSDHAFIAELRSKTHYLNQEQGRFYQNMCDAEFGDQRCAVAIARHQRESSIIDTDGLFRIVFEEKDALDLPEKYFRWGTLTFREGSGSAQKFRIKDHLAPNVVFLWEAPVLKVKTGQRILLTAGCDKRFQSCEALFQNTLNFRGFPHIPTPEFVLSYARSGEGGHDGGIVRS